MASNSHSQATGPGARPISKKVTAQHTLERVRNNQRRHRARRKDYIATLEQKLSQAEQSVMILRDQVDALEAELAQYRGQGGQIVSGCTLLPGQLQNDGGKSPPPLASPEETDFQALGLLPDVVDLGILTPSTPLPFQLPPSDNLPGGLFPDLVDAISPHAGPEHIDRPAESEILRALVPLAPSPKHTAETPLVVAPWSTGTLLSATATPDPIPMTTGTCCSDRHSLNPGDHMTDEHAVVMSLENPPLLPGYVFQPAMRAYYQYSTVDESTMLCAEAYLLIAQQNFKGVGQKDVATWLWNGFRKSLSPGEGCRVKTDLLYSLLAFISDA